MSNARQAQVLHINQMFLAGALSRAQFEEFNQMATSGQLTRAIAQQILEGKFKFKNTLSDAHLAKVRTVWKKFGKSVFGVTFEKYLSGTDHLEAIPSLPIWPPAYLTAFDRDVLVDGRVVERIGLIETCKLAGLAYSGQNDTRVAYEKARAKTGVRWMRGQPGHKNRNRTPVDCRKSFAEAGYEVGMDAPEGVFTYVDDPQVISNHYMVLPGSVDRGDRYYVACVGPFYGEPGLCWVFDGYAFPRFGAASHGE